MYKGIILYGVGRQAGNVQPFPGVTRPVIDAIRPLTLDDVDSAMALSTEAGWNQLPDDWRRLISLWPDSAIGLWRGGRLVATATLATYGRAIGWIGMILVAADQRKQGIGGRMFQVICERGEQLGIERLGLDATPFGRPVYLKHGFVDHSVIRRWTGEPAGGAKGDVHPIAQGDWPSIEQMDRTATGVDRAPLLHHMAGESNAIAACTDAGDFGFARPGRTASMIGPLIARDAHASTMLFDDLAAECRRRWADRPIILDVPDASPLEAHLNALGWQPARTLMRMVRPASAKPLLTGPHVVAATSFALG